jgi:hypothetical protein
MEEASLPWVPKPRSTLRKTWYRQTYLNSNHWSWVRELVIARQSGRCAVCTNRTRLDVHHHTYKRLWRELPSDVVGYCRDCHDAHHWDAQQNRYSRRFARRPKKPDNPWMTAFYVLSCVTAGAPLIIAGTAMLLYKSLVLALRAATKTAGLTLRPVLRLLWKRRRDNVLRSRWALDAADEIPAVAD